MLQVGRKIYYELNTGNVIMIRESRSGSVTETTKEQDFTNYVALQPYQLSAVGEIQVGYGSQDEQNLSKYYCHIDITDPNNPFIVWDLTPIQQEEVARQATLEEEIQRLQQNLTQDSADLGSFMDFYYSMNP
jgi:hypothetical protein